MNDSVCPAFLVSVDDTFYFVQCGHAEEFISLVIASGSISKIVFHAQGKFFVSRFKDHYYVQI